MAQVLFVSPNDLTKGTLIGGNVDADKYLPCIESAQQKVIEELLGTELYDKMLTDYTSDISTGVFIPNAVAGDYLIMLNDYIKPILKFESCADYITISPYVLSNAGLLTSQPDRYLKVEKEEKESLSNWHHSISMMHVGRFHKWMNLNEKNIPEYKTVQDEVDASKNQNLNPGWYLR